MWCSDRRGFLAALALPALAGACGFTPLYGEGAPATAMAGRVDVGLIEGAAGFTMRERLTGRLGPATAPTHRLDVALELERTGVALTQENITTRYNVVGTATYALFPLAGGPAVTSGTLRLVTGYSAPTTAAASAFAIRAAERDAGQRLAVNLADQIVQRLALTAPDWT
jgi:LPS-assembly lipoprotein